MKKNLAFDLSILALLCLTVLLIPSVASILNASCTVSSASSAPSTVTAVVSSNTLSTVSGINQTLHTAVINMGDQAFENGALTLSIYREPKTGDFSNGKRLFAGQVLVKDGIMLAASSTIEYPFVWAIPATLPTGVYTIEAHFSQGNTMFANAGVRAKDPFGNDAKIFITGDSKNTAFFTAGPQQSDVSAASTVGSCDTAKTSLYLWAVLISAVGVVMLMVGHLFTKKQ